MAMQPPREQKQRSLRAQLLGDLLGTVAGTTGALVNGVGNTVSAATTGLGTTATAATTTVGNTVGAATTGLGTAVPNVINGVGNTVNAAATTVGSVVNAATTGASNIVNTVATDLGETVGDVGETVNDVVKAAGAGVGDIVDNATTGLSNTATAVGDVVKNVVQPLVAPIVAPLNPILSPIVASLAPIVNPIVSPIVAPLNPILAPIVAPLAPIVAPIVSPIVSPIAPIISPIVEPIAPIVTPLIGPIAPQPTLAPSNPPPAATPAPPAPGVLPTSPPVVAPIPTPPVVAPIPTLPVVAPIPTLPVVAPILTPPVVAPIPNPPAVVPANTPPAVNPNTPSPVIVPANPSPSPASPSPQATPSPAGTTPATPSPTLSPSVPQATPSVAQTSPIATPPPVAEPSPTSNAPHVTPSPVSPTEPPTKATTPPPTITVDSLDVGRPSSMNGDEFTPTTYPSLADRPASFVSTTSDGTGHNSNRSPLPGSPGVPGGSRDTDSAGAATVRMLTGIGMSFGVAATLVLAIAAIMYVRRQRSKVQNQYKSDTFDPAELDSQRSDLDTYGSYMTGNLTATASAHLIASASSAWDDDELLVVRVPLELVVRDELLCAGAFGEVYRGKFHAQDVAIKTLVPSKRKDINQIKAFQAEIKLMASLEHPRIVKFVGVAWESLADLCVVTEFMAGGDLTTLLASFEANARPRGFDLEKVKIALHVAHALMYLHSLQPAVIHRDLKSKNVLLDADWNAKVTDFGVSRERTDETMTSGVGSSLWMAPEMTLGERYDEKADIFAFGVLLSELDTQQLPYAHARSDETNQPIPPTTVLQLVSVGGLTIKLTETPYFQEMQRLALRCVELDPKNRPSAAEALHCIHVAWTAALDAHAVNL